MSKLHKLKGAFLVATALLLGGVITLATPLSVLAAAQVGVSPATSEIVLQPGQTYTASLTVFNNGDETLNYQVYTTPYSIESDDDGNIQQIYEGTSASNSSYTTIADWITFDADTGTVDPGESGVYVNYTITVPEDATPGGQYAAIMVEQASDGDSAGLTSTVRAAFLIYAIVAGDVTETATISDVDISAFYSGAISVSSLVENTGNVHGTATYTLQVFPLFSDEEVYTNEEDPETHIIYPGTKYYNSLTWEDTPSFGIYRVVETVTLFGETTTTERTVIVCPTWLALVIIFVVVFIVVWLIIRGRKRKQNRQQEVAHV